MKVCYGYKVKLDQRIIVTPNTCSNIYRETEKLEKIQAVGTSDLKSNFFNDNDTSCM